MISFIIPSYNNLDHLQNVYNSIQKHVPEAEVVLLDDGSTDGTWEWCQHIQKNSPTGVKIFRSETRVGHTILYDLGIGLASNEIVGILHADMILGPNYIQNTLKHLERGKVVCATRIEPPLHPPGKEKIISNFGINFDTLDVKGFEEFCYSLQAEEQGKVTRGMFAPWLVYKEDFVKLGGHDPLFAPFPYEDSDLFQRFILAGYDLIQSRDAFVYHLTCRGHRWTQQIGQDDEYYKQVSLKASRNFLRKWGSWIENDEYQYPVITPKYFITLEVEKCDLQTLYQLEPLCSRIFVDSEDLINRYINQEQTDTTYDLKERVQLKSTEGPEERGILVKLPSGPVTSDTINLLLQLPKIIKSSGSVGVFTLGDLEVYIYSMEELQQELIINKR